MRKFFSSIVGQFVGERWVLRAARACCAVSFFRHAVCEHFSFSPKACNCSSAGSAHLQCDGETGQCQCRAGFGGPDCSRCALGYRDYPDCVACDCDLSGTEAETCDDAEGVCGCEEETGGCTCKVLKWFGAALGLWGRSLLRAWGVQEGVKRGQDQDPPYALTAKHPFLGTWPISRLRSPCSLVLNSGRWFLPRRIHVFVLGTEWISVTTWFLQHLESSVSRIGAGRWKWMRGHLSCFPSAPRVVCFLLNRTKHWPGVRGQQFC